MRQAGEPSVEEILNSIKQVIARDNREIASATRKRREEDNVRDDDSDLIADDEDSEVLDLAEAGEVLADDGADTDEDETTQETDDSAPIDSALVDSALVDSGAEQAMRDSLAALAMLAEPPRKPQIVRSGETSLEELTRELMRPMLKEWLDTNLPNMVEQLVAAEIARIAGKKDR